MLVAMFLMLRVGKAAKWIKETAAKPDHIDLILGTKMLKKWTQM